MNVLTARLMSPLLALFLTTLLAACGEDPVLPPAKPLSAPAAAIDALYGAQPGEHEVRIARDLVLPETALRRELTFNLVYPAHGGDYPLLVFSHGNFSSKDSYDRVIEHLVSHGYAVIAPNHLDCCSMVGGIVASLRLGQYGQIEARQQDVIALLDALTEIDSLAPAFAGKYDIDKLAMAGHSFGAFSAQQFGGAAAYNPDQEAYIDAFDARVKAIFALSPPGPMFDTITADSWTQLRLPTLVTTGTWDVQKGFWTDYRMHLMSHDRSPAGDKYALVIDGADHYLGNLICRPEREAEPQHDALRMVNAMGVAFLDAYLKNLPLAWAALQKDRMAEVSDGFARLDRR
ncbi:hypothetical protein EY643_12970 [Halioglobus maricola]|uniref:Alpha/beta hydrolase n=1 Tax=Halioglobus maricola TaxID=2601894 RepID=A0A5P9NLW4_9GAMM|nr:alpha/beta fold hydrolase [Halioglobus maricola]QFU76496.1 hypothetical protein EY643_12970 [Halioglobus maricola]